MRRYLAFISYRHREPDQQVSTALLRGLEGYHLPKDSGLPARRRVFRDTDELPTGTDLGANIEGALDESEWLIALCSREYLASQWCLLEIERFIRMGRKDRILPVLLADTPETAVPEGIRDVPVAADLRGEDLSYDRKKLPGAVPALLARMAGGREEACGPGGPALQAEDFAAAERGFRLRAGAGAVACLLAGILGFAAYALHTADLIAQGNVKIAEAADQAELARAAAEEQRKNALRKNAQYTAEQSLAEYHAGHEKEAIRLALSALPEDLEGGEPVSPEALGALRIAMSLPRISYRKKTSAETESGITGFTYFDSKRLLLEEDTYSETGTFLNYDTGELEQENSAGRAEAFSEGYSRVFDLKGMYSSWNKVYCGAEKQARIIGPDGKTKDLTLHGTPFYADRILYETDKGRFLAWLEEPMEGQEQHAAVFSEEQAEAIAEIPAAGTPVLAEFYADHFAYPEMLLIDSEGTLSVYNTEDGSGIRVFDGTWNAAYFLDQNGQPAVLAADDSGWSLLKMSSGEALMKVETPSPVRGLAYCPNHTAVLVCCDDGVRIYSLATGNVLWSRTGEEPPRSALWAGAAPGRYAAVDGNAIVLLFDRRAEVWTLETEGDGDRTEAVPLYREGVPNRSEQVFFTDDGTKVFVQMRDGTLAAFDGRDGAFLWAREGSLHPTASHFPSTISSDGSAIWRDGGNKGRERIDIETGRILYSLMDSAGREPVEMPELGLGMLPGSSRDGLKCFDLATGEILWESGPLESAVRSEYPGYPIFSEDGKTVIYISVEYGTEEHVQEVRWSRIESRTGKVLEERTLIRAPHLEPEELNEQYRLFVRGEEKSAVFSVFPGKAPAGLPLFLIDLEKGEVIAELKTPGPNTHVIFPAAGGAALRWMEGPSEIIYGLENEGYYEDSYIFCCRLNADGTAGRTIPADSEEGRRLLARESQLVTFAGEEAMLNTVQIDRNERYNSYRPNQIRRIADNALLLDAGDNIIAASPAGEMSAFTAIISPLLSLRTFCRILMRRLWSGRRKSAWRSCNDHAERDRDGISAVSRKPMDGGAIEKRAFVLPDPVSRAEADGDQEGGRGRDAGADRLLYAGKRA